MSIDLKRGIVYGASKLAYFEETIISAHSVKQQMPYIPIELFIHPTTHEQVKDLLDLSQYFDFVNLMDGESHWRTPKFTALRTTRFEQVIYLDGDTFVTDSVMELFEILDQFDLAIAHSPQRIHSLSIKLQVDDFLGKIPLAFPEYNGGILVFKRTEKVDAFLEKWMTTFEQCWKETNYPMDQASFRYCLYHADLRIATLTPEYNFRALAPATVRGKVKIIHAHGDLPKIASLININQKAQRNWNPPKNLLYGFGPQQTAETTEAEIDCLKKGILQTVSRLARINQ